MEMLSINASLYGKVPQNADFSFYRTENYQLLKNQLFGHKRGV